MVEIQDGLTKEMEESLNLPKTNPKDEDSPLPIIKPTLEDLNIGVEVINQDDPNSPLYSIKKFEELNLKPDLLKGVFAMGFKKPSKIQESALPLILSDPPKNLIAQAQSGTGKTAAFVLGMLSRCDPEIKFPQALCVCPTRELARQIQTVIAQMGQFTNLKIQLILKEEEYPKTIDSQILVGTPGRFLDLIRKKSINTSKIRILVLDEADQMIDKQGLGEQTVKLKKEMPRHCQTLLFSATFADNVRGYAQRIVSEPRANITLKKEELTLEGIQQLFIDCGDEQKKFSILEEIYNYMSVGQSIIFVHTRKTALQIAQRMNAAGHRIATLVGGEDMTPADRDRVMDDFKKAKIRVLITTNVLARGIDVLAVTLVVNYDLPLDAYNKPDPQTYLHRIGRSGRFGRKGIAINFVHDEESKRNLRFFEKHFNIRINEFPKEKIDDLQSMLEKIQDEAQKEFLRRAALESNQKT